MHRSVRGYFPTVVVSDSVALLTSLTIAIARLDVLRISQIRQNRLLEDNQRTEEALRHLMAHALRDVLFSDLGVQLDILDSLSNATYLSDG